MDTYHVHAGFLEIMPLDVIKITISFSVAQYKFLTSYHKSYLFFKAPKWE